MREPDNVYRFRRLKWRAPELLPSLRRYAAAKLKTRRLDLLFIVCMPVAAIVGAILVFWLR